ncbi:MAG TPA: M15 family metallopeptidase [Rhodanobacteraceae bacterium]
MSDSELPASPPARCRTAVARRALIARAYALGIPRTYGRERHLRVQREPLQLAPIGLDIYNRPQWLQPRAARAYASMCRVALAASVTLQVVSAFRSIEYQLGIIERKLARGETLDAILRVSAAPGYSEHHTGRCVDLTTPGFAALEEAFEHSTAFAWLTQHAARFGFTLSYPRDNPHGIAYEPWHWCWHPKPASR